MFSDSKPNTPNKQWRALVRLNANPASNIGVHQTRASQTMGRETNRLAKPDMFLLTNGTFACIIDI